MRLLMITSKRLEKEGGGHQDFREGSIYLVDKALGREWKEQGIACDPDTPLEEIERLGNRALGIPEPEPIQAPQEPEKAGDS